jgi:hypothetical protein
MEQVKKEASKFLSGGSGQRAVVDGVKVYSEKELEEEMGGLGSSLPSSAAHLSGLPVLSVREVLKGVILWLVVLTMMAVVNANAGEGAWEAFQDAADDSLAKGLTSKDYW